MTRSLSNVIKSVTFTSENPLKLKEHYNAKKAGTGSTKSINNLDLTYPKIYEDEASQLLEEAISKAREIIEDAKAQAAEIISKAEKQKEDIENKAFNKGYSEGLKAAMKDQQEKWNEYTENFKESLQNVLTKNESYKKHLEKECIKLSLMVAEKILQQKIEEPNNEYLVNLVRNSLKKLGEEKGAIIRVSESDYDKVHELALAGDNNLRQITVIKDPFLSCGDCIIESPSGQIDAGIHTQIENIRLSLKELGVISDA